MENTKSGREPIVKLTLKQDFCANTWGEYPCGAGAINMVEHSNLEPFSVFTWTPIIEESIGTYTQSGSLYPVISGAPFPFDTYKTVLAGASTSSTANNYRLKYVSAGVIVNPLNTEFMWFQGVFKLDASLTNYVGIECYNTSSLHRVMFNQSTMAFVSNSGFVEYSIENIYSDYYLIKAKANTADVLGGRFAFVSHSLAGNADASFRFGFPIISPNENQRFVKTQDEIFISQETKPCFNTRATCQAISNYTAETLPLKFIKSRSPAPDDDYYLPSLDSISVTPARINPAGSNKSASALGTRATFSATFKDHPHDDKLVDKYRDQRDYNPLERGTFWTKWAARNPYYMHRIVEIDSGYLLDGEIVDAVKRSFVITSFDRVDSSGTVKISGKDFLTLAENEKAQAPKQSSGKLSADLLAAGTSFSVSPSGVGDLEYSTITNSVSGFVRIEKEIIEVTRVADTFTVVTRGYKASGTDDHSADATVQLCLEYDAELAVDILYDLLLNYANIPSAYLDKANWDIEGGNYLPRLYSTLITEPTGISQLIGEMCEQMFFTTWWDERDNLVKVRAVRAPADDNIYSLDDNGSFIKDSVSWGDLPDQLITQINVFYAQINPALKLDESTNYSTVETVINTSASSAEKYGISKIKTIYSRWIDSASTALDLANKYAEMFGDIPKTASFKLDAKDNQIWLGDFVKMNNRLLLDQFGLPRQANMQIISANESEAGSQFSYQANEYFISKTETSGEINVIIASNRLNVNLRDLFDSEWGVTLTGTETINFIVRSGVIIGGDTCGGGVNVFEAERNAANDFYDAGTASLGGRAVGTIPALQRRGITAYRSIAKDALYPSTSNYANWEIKEYPLSTALETGTFPAGTIVNLIIEQGAYIDGEGGNGGAHSFKESTGVSSILHAASGGDGGHALKIDFPINIYNYGVITAGAGGGGGVCIESTSSSLIMNSGGCGAGYLTNRYIEGILSTTRSVPSAANIYGVDDSSSTITFTSDPSAVISGGSAYWCQWKANYLITRGDSGMGGGSYGTLPAGKVFSDFANGSGADYVYKSETNIIYGSGDLNNSSLCGDAIVSGANLVTWAYKGDVRGAENV